MGVVRFAPFQMKTGPNLPGREPDLLFIAQEHLDRLKGTYLEGPADLVVEIVSPDSGARDRGEKFYEYERGGVPEYWLLDYARRQAEFYQLGQDAFIAWFLWVRTAFTAAPFSRGCGSKWTGCGSCRTR